MKYEELDFQKTSLGDLMLRRRRMAQFGDLDIYEVKLGENFLMSSLFHEAEHQLAKLGLGLLTTENLEVVVGGLGLGFTAVSALQDKRVSSLVVVEFLKPVIEWHQKGLVPLGKTLMEDSRCGFVHGDFFAMSCEVSKSFDPENPGQKYDAILLDIDHSPTQVLHRTNSHFYTDQGLRELAQHLKPGGVFALWADGEPESSFTKQLAKVFARAESRTIEFENPLTGGTSKGAVYLSQ